MECLIELHITDIVALHFFVAKLELLSQVGPVSWKSCKTDGLNDARNPDLSLIDVTGMNWVKLINVVNKCRGREIAVWGEASSSMGFSRLQKNFSAEDLLSLTPWVVIPSIEKIHVLPIKKVFNPYDSQYTSTVPMPINLMNLS
jgi:hypothetical protein